MYIAKGSAAELQTQISNKFPQINLAVFQGQLVHADFRRQ